MSAIDLGPSHRVALPSVLDMRAAQGLKDLLLDAVAMSRNIVVDGSAVERASTPAVQVLLSAAASLSTGGGRLSVSAPSEPLQSAFRDLGLSDAFQQLAGAHE
jgi:anti-anti-sigma regulatory factor